MRKLIIIITAIVVCSVNSNAQQLFEKRDSDSDI